MAKYKVVREFRDTKHDHVYKVGDEYPIEGKRATKARIETLSTTKNSYKKIYIKEVQETPIEKE